MAGHDLSKQEIGEEIADLGAALFLLDLALGILFYAVADPMIFVYGALGGLVTVFIGFELEFSS